MIKITGIEFLKRYQNWYRTSAKVSKYSEVTGMIYKQKRIESQIQG